MCFKWAENFFPSLFSSSADWDCEADKMILLVKERNFVLVSECCCGFGLESRRFGALMEGTLSEMFERQINKMLIEFDKMFWV